MKKLIFLAFCLQTLIRVQSQANIKSIGDKIAEIRFDRIVNFSSTTAGLSDYKDKIIILDFWSTKCLSCIHSMPHSAALQKEFAGKIQVFLVTYEKTAIIDAFYKKRPDIKALNLPIVTEDTLLHAMFPHEGNPFVIWIGKDRRVKAMTTGEQLTGQNLERLLQKNELMLPVKKSILNFNYETDFLTPREDMEIKPLSSSVFTKEIDGLRGWQTFRHLPDGRAKILATNVSIEHLYISAYQPDINLRNYQDRRALVIWEDSSGRRLTQRDVWGMGNYCYELIVPDTDNNGKKRVQRDLFPFMKDDLDRFFNFKSRVEIRNEKCLVLSATNDSLINGSDSSWVKETLEYYEIHNMPISKAWPTIKSYFPADSPLVYEGSQDKRISMRIELKKNDLPSFKNCLKQSGIEVTEAVRSLKMLVITAK